MKIPYEVAFEINVALINRINNHWQHRKDPYLRQRLKKLIEALRYVQKNAKVY